MVVQWMRDVVDVAEIRRISDGALLAPVQLPSLGTMSAISTEPRRASTEFWFSLTSFLDPSAKYRCDAAALAAVGVSGATNGDAKVSVSPAASPEVQLHHRTELKVEHDPQEYVTKQVFVRSKDGTKVPMFIVHHKDAQLDGGNPTLLYGYGGFNISLQPSFSATRCVALNVHHVSWIQYLTLAAAALTAVIFACRRHDHSAGEYRHFVHQLLPARTTHIVQRSLRAPLRGTVQNWYALITQCSLDGIARRQSVQLTTRLSGYRGAGSRG